MGFFSSMNQQQALPPMMPFNPPLGVLTNFCVPHEVTLCLREKIWSFTGDDFSIKDAQGQDVVICKGKVFSLRDKKTFTDARGNVVYTLENKIMSFLKTFRCYKADGQLAFSVKSKLTFMKDRMSCEFTNAADGSLCVLEVNGDWLDRRASITIQGREVARISRNFLNVAQVFADRQTYFCSVAPGVDLAMIAVLCVCLDEKANDKN